MDRFDKIHKERITALLQAIYATKSIRDDNVPCQIEEGLYLGSLGAANNESALKSLNITHILTMASSLPPAHPNEFKYKIVAVADQFDVNISQYFDDCFSFIDEAKEMGGGILVDCFAGRSRRSRVMDDLLAWFYRGEPFIDYLTFMSFISSVAIVVAYLMKKRGMRFCIALEYVKSKRPVACPNSGFLLQLQDFEKSLQDRVRGPGCQLSVEELAAQVQKWFCSDANEGDGKHYSIVRVISL